MSIWVYVCIGFLIVVGIAVAIWVATAYDLPLAKPNAPSPPPEAIAPELPIAEPEPEPLTLADIGITVIRIDTNITVILAWAETPQEMPFHLWVSVENGNLILNAPDNEPRKVEILPNQALTLYGSTLHHEASDNRLAIDLQVETDTAD